MKQLFDRCFQYPDHLVEPANSGKEYGNMATDRPSHEYANLPPLDIRTTARWCYFDIALPGVTDKASIKIQWISSQTFVVEGEIPRARISLRDELDDDPTVDPPRGPTSLNGDNTHKHDTTAVDESVTLDHETAPELKDKYPGFSHLRRCPGSGIHRDTDGDTDGNDRPIHSTSTDPRDLEDDREVVERSRRRPHPMDEIALIRSRSHGSRTSSFRRRPHNDRDIQPVARAFSWLSNHNERQSPQHVARSSSAASDDVPRSVEDRDEPLLVLAELPIGPYKRRCTIPGHGAVAVDVERTQARLDAGLLTVRVPKRTARVGGEERGGSFSGQKVVVD